MKALLQLPLVLSILMALAGCPSPSVPVRLDPPARPQIPPLPPHLVKREPNLRQRLEQLSMPSPAMAIKASVTPTPASTSTTAYGAR